MQTNLPVATCLPELKSALADAPAAILTADTGSGKTTWLPLQLLSEPWLAGKKIIMLEPRRVAARAAAARLAFHLGETPGKTVGYSVRFDSKVSKDTRIEVVTEGILARRIVSDPELTGVGLVIFDEFHERHVETDLALALTLECHKVFRSDLKMLVMSATIDTTAIGNFLNAALLPDGKKQIPIISSAGTNFPVELKYHNEQIEQGNRAMAVACARKAIEVHAKHKGDVLVFLPGTAEIFMATEFIEDRNLSQTKVLPLYGELSAAEQDQVLSPPKPNERRIIVATPIAESSLTLEGLTVVIDSGLVRQPALDIGTGLSYLETVPITQDSAVQRAGRAGRLGPGTCYRMYTEADFRRRPRTRAPEILRTDLADASLRTLAFGSPLKSLMLPDMPSAAALSQAEKLLRDLGCLDRQGKLTGTGKKASALPLPPRLAVMLAEAPSQQTALLAAQLSERDAMRVTGAMATDLEIRFQSLQKFIESGDVPQGADRRGLEAIRKVYQQLLKSAPTAQTLATALLYAYPDRVAIRREPVDMDVSGSRATGGRSGREPGSFLLRGGRGVYTDKSDWLADSEFIVAVDVSGSEKNAKLRLALSVSRAEVLAHFENNITKRQEIREVNGKPRAYELTCLDAIVLSEKETALPAGFAEKLVLQKVRETGLARLFSDEAVSLCARVELLRGWGQTLPSFAEADLAATLEDWLAPFTQGAKALQEISASVVQQALEARLSYAQQKLLEEKLPARLSVPSGSSHCIHYHDGKAVISVRIQEVFGLDAHPVLADGRLPVTLELLSPGKQPIATTLNLPAF